MNLLKGIILNQIQNKHYCMSCQNITRVCSYSVSRYFSTDSLEEDKKAAKKEVKVTLLSDGDKIEITNLKEAQKKALRRSLKLVKVVDLDSKTQRPVYRLMSGAEYFALESKQRELQKKSKNQFKGEKLLSMSGRIESHDLASKVKLIEKWIAKYFEVRVVVTKDGCDPKKIEAIVNEICRGTEGNANIVQKRSSNSDIRFTLAPLKSVPEITEKHDQQ